MPIVIVLIAVLIGAARPVSAHYGQKFEPPDGRIYHGVGWNGHNAQANYTAIFPPAHHPLVLQVNTDLPGFRDTDVARTIRSLTGLITHPDSQYIEYSLHFRDRRGMLDSLFVFTDELDRYMDTLAIAFRAVDRPIFLRIGFEFNGNWNPYHPFIFPRAFQKLVDGLRERGFNRFATVWCYEPDAAADFADSNRAGWKWYPGDNYVDWFGLDPFDAEHFDPDQPDSLRGQLTRKGKSEAFLRFARERGKPVYLNELSARHVYITPDEADADSADGIHDWEYWFEPFFEFLGNHPEIKGMNYINLEWPRYEAYRDWGDARLEINSYIKNRWVERVIDDRFINVGWDIEKELSAGRVDVLLPVGLSLEAWPNPFNSGLNLRWVGAKSPYARLTIWDAGGRMVWVSSAATGLIGGNALSWEARNFAAGTYWLQLESGGEVLRKPVILLK